MLNAFINMWRVPDLRNRILFTLAMLVIYRLGYFVPILGIDQQSLRDFADAASQNEGSAAGNLMQVVSMFTGGTLSQSTIFGLGIAPYISASIIFQLLATVLPSLKAIQKEGPAGRQKIQEWTRYATVGLCIIQAAVWLKFLQTGTDSGPMVHVEYLNTATFWICGIAALTAGTCFLMWIGEQIDRYGIGNGVSLIIAAGIISRKPAAIMEIASQFSMSGDAHYTPTTVIFLLVAFVVVVAGSILITQGQRRIQIQQAMHTRGRRVVGGHKSYLPLRVNHGGVMPIIFASSLMLFPSMIFTWMHSHYGSHGIWEFLDTNFRFDRYLHILVYIVMIYFFAYFWTTVQFQPKEMATELQRHGSFIPGLRPGPRTAEYLETVMERITYVGAGFLAVIAIIPTVVSSAFGVPWHISNFLGGTGLLIVVSVMLDLIQRIEANLMMRNHQGFLGGGAGGKGPKVRGSRNM